MDEKLLDSAINEVVKEMTPEKRKQVRRMVTRSKSDIVKNKIKSIIFF